MMVTAFVLSSPHHLSHFTCANEITMHFKTFFSKQAGNPSGLFGRIIMSKIFDLGNAPLNRLMKEHLGLEENDHVLEIGFGTGKLLNEMPELMNKGLIEGIDISATMVRIAERKNKSFISQGKMILKQGDFETENYDENRFDKICSANTLYFWPAPEKTIQKIVKILKPNGKLILAFEDKKQLEKRSLNFDIFHAYGKTELKEMLLNNGFSKNIKMKSKKIKSNTFHCCIAEK